jgi:acetolactate synthase-1/3 small subunit
MAEELIHIVARDRSRVLVEIVSVLAHRGVSVVSLSSWRSTEDDMLRVHVVIDVDSPLEVDRAHKWLNRIVEVVKVVRMADDSSHRRTAVLVKVNAGPAERGLVSDIVRAVRAEIVEVSPTVMTLAYYAPSRSVDTFLTLLAPHGVLESVVVGTGAVMRGERRLHRPSGAIGLASRGVTRPDQPGRRFANDHLEDQRESSPRHLERPGTRTG